MPRAQDALERPTYGPLLFVWLDCDAALGFADHPGEAEAAGKIVLPADQRAVVELRAGEPVVAQERADPVLRKSFRQRSQHVHAGVTAVGIVFGPICPSE